MEDVKAKVANRLKEANNVLVSVTNNPSVDQFASAIALTLILNKLGKHATTVFSGTIPSTIEFLQPEKIVEKNTDSLRDFIISLDKSKADKLRYKIEDNFVKIFITPYHSSIGEKDLVFSQGDFNVDVVVGIGVHQREELDQSITAHGRILHDATVMTINTRPPSNLGSINWSDDKSSSVCEMLVSLSDLLAKQGLFDTQISNALLTGIVAETQRFSNEKTTSSTMSASSKLLASGANQQLVATELTPKPEPVAEPKPEAAVTQSENTPATKTGDAIPKALPAVEKPSTGELKIDHPRIDLNSNDSLDEHSPNNESVDDKVTQVVIDEQGTLQKIDPNAPGTPAAPAEQPPQAEPLPTVVDDTPAPPPAPADPTYVPPPLIPIPPDENEGSDKDSGSVPPVQQLDAPAAPADSNNNFLDGPKLVLEPPTMTGQLNANESGVVDDEGFPDPLSTLGLGAPSSSMPTPMLNHNSGQAMPPDQNGAQATPTIPPLSTPADDQSGVLPNLADVRSAVDSALSSSPPDVSNQPLASLNAQPINLDLSQAPLPSANQAAPMPDPAVSVPPASPAFPDPLQSQAMPSFSPNNVPPVPPPMIPLNDNNLPPSFTAL